MKTISLLLAVTLFAVPVLAAEKTPLTGSGGRYHWDANAYIEDDEITKTLVWYNQEESDEASSSALAKKMMMVQWGKAPFEYLFKISMEVLAEREWDSESVKEFYRYFGSFDWDIVNAKYSYHIFTAYSEQQIQSLFDDALHHKGAKMPQEHTKLNKKLTEIVREAMTTGSRK